MLSNDKNTLSCLVKTLNQATTSNSEETIYKSLMENQGQRGIENKRTRTQMDWSGLGKQVIMIRLL